MRDRSLLTAARWLAALSLSAVAPPAAAQSTDASARLERVADGVYVIIHDDATDEWPHGNTGVVVTGDGVLVVDATYLPSRARGDIALIRTVTDKPVRYLVYTHWHFDHNNGAVAYREAFPGLTIVSERQTRDWITLNADWWARMSTATGSARRASLAALEQEATSGKDTTGRALTADERRHDAQAVGQRKAELAELASLTVVPPNLVFDGALTLWLGGRRIELQDRGRANSPHDVTIYLPQDSVLFTGDIVVQSPLPYVGASWPVAWIEVLQRLESVPAKALVPGHGPVMRDFRYVRQVRGMLEAATSRVAALALKGRTLEQVQDSVTLEDVRRAVPVWQDPKLDADWKDNTRVLVERAWRGVRGQGG
jgi:cyclase